MLDGENLTNLNENLLGRNKLISVLCHIASRMYSINQRNMYFLTITDIQNDECISIDANPTVNNNKHMTDDANYALTSPLKNDLISNQDNFTAQSNIAKHLRFMKLRKKKSKLKKKVIFFIHLETQCNGYRTNITDPIASTVFLEDNFDLDKEKFTVQIRSYTGK